MWSETTSGARWALTFLVAAACGGSDGGPRGELDAQVVPEPDAGPEERADAGAPDAGAPDAARDAASDAAPDSAIADASSAPFVCGTVAPTACPTPPTRYSDVKPIFAARCESCHSPLWTGPWPLDEYEHVSDWQSDIRTAMLDCSMPPRDSGSTMTVEERQQILSFLRCGLPQ